MLRIKTRGIEGLKQKISELPRGARGIATMESSKYFIGNERRGLQYYPNRVQHGEGNPYQWASEKQRRAFFASDGFGRGIPSRRTDSLRFGWRVNSWASGTKTTIVNTEPHALFVMGDAQQQGHIADRWKHYSQVIADSMAGAMRAVDSAVARWLKSKGW